MVDWFELTAADHSVSNEIFKNYTVNKDLNFRAKARLQIHPMIQALFPKRFTPLCLCVWWLLWIYTALYSKTWQICWHISNCARVMCVSDLTANRCCHCTWAQGRCLFWTWAVRLGFEEALLTKITWASWYCLATWFWCWLIVFVFGCLGDVHILIVRELQVSGCCLQNVGINKRVKMCVYVCFSVSMFHFLSADPATSLGFFNMTHRLSVFHESFTWK